MDCEKHRENISAYADGELSEAEKHELEKHLEQCESCAEELEKIQRLRQSVGQLSKMTAPDGFADEIMTKIRSKNTSPEERSKKVSVGRGPLGSIFFAAAAMFIIALILVFTFMQRNENTEVASVSPGEELKNIKTAGSKSADLKENLQAPVKGLDKEAIPMFGAGETTTPGSKNRKTRSSAMETLRKSLDVKEDAEYSRKLEDKSPGNDTGAPSGSWADESPAPESKDKDFAKSESKAGGGAAQSGIPRKMTREKQKEPEASERDNELTITSSDPELTRKAIEAMLRSKEASISSIKNAEGEILMAVNLDRNELEKFKARLRAMKDSNGRDEQGDLSGKAPTDSDNKLETAKEPVDRRHRNLEDNAREQKKKQDELDNGGSEQVRVILRIIKK